MESQKPEDTIREIQTPEQGWQGKFVGFDTVMVIDDIKKWRRATSEIPRGTFSYAFYADIDSPEMERREHPLQDSTDRFPRPDKPRVSPLMGQHHLER